MAKANATIGELRPEGRDSGAVASNPTTLAQQTSLSDSFHRTIDYMRISVTDRCNMRCLYCMPEQGVPWLDRKNILTYEEIARIVSATASLGMRGLRITGGEPLVRHDLSDLVRMLAAVPGIEDVALSTNAVLLAGHAKSLASAGLNRVNVSLDSLSADRFARIARREFLPRALAGIVAAEAVGLTPIKINCVAMRGFNEDDLAAMAALTVEHEYHVRFIEIMPLHGNVQFQSDWFIPASEILDRVHVLGDLEPCSGPRGNGPARYWRLPGAKGTVGVISPLTHTYCETCNRVRLTADGQLRLCLFGEHQIDLRTPLRAGATVDDLRAIFLEAIMAKPEHHNLQVGQTCTGLQALSQIGG